MVWIDVLLVVCAAAAALGVWVVHRRLTELERAAGALGHLEELAVSVKKLAGDRGDLDLRRVEHVLIEIRDAQRRLEDALLRVSEQALARGGSSLAPAANFATGGGLAERVVTRLVALGYDRVQILPPAEELARIAAGDGEVTVEARRNGVACKGRVLVRGGALTEVDLKPAYATFP
ncbi:MAG: hypothetical protein K8S98_09845 [Planctomycetes bacterium]|nr:hypothetical protein [Planctomycetota bacterium]